MKRTMRVLTASGLIVCAAPAASQGVPSAPPAPPPACTAPEHRQFDFWVGYWDVYPTGKPKLVAHSLIERLYGGCTIRENWMPLTGGAGGSLNMYDPDDKRWHQIWQDSSNARVAFDGGLVGEKMVLTGFWRGVLGPGDALVRMEYSRTADGSVRQHGLQSIDQGVTWQESFDFTYRKSTSPAPN